MSRTLTSIHRATIALVALAIWSCGGATPTGDVVGSVGAVVVSPPSSTLALNSTLPLQAEVHDLAGAVLSNLPVAWTVKDPGIATVSETGVVTGKSLGTTQVAASSGGKSGIATITVQKTPVASVSIQPNRVDAVVGSRNQLTGRASDEAGNVLADRAIIWTSSNPHVATVDGTGLVIALAPGSTTITGASEGKTATSVFTVTQGAVASVAVTPSPVTMLAGQSTQLAASARDAAGAVIGGKTFVWSSSNTAVATVASDGTVKAVGAGSATITATADGVSGTSAVTVSNIPVATVEVTPQGPSLSVGETRALTAVTKDAGGTRLENRAVTWTSSNPNVAVVSSAAVVTAVSPGTTTITATSEGKIGTSIVTVVAPPPTPVASVTIEPTSASLIPGQKVTFTATARDANGNALTGRAITWETSAPLVGSLSTTSGTSTEVTGLAIGSTTIKATSETKSGTATVTVTAVPVASITIAPTSPSIVQNGKTTLTATVKDASGNTLTGRTITWETSAPLVGSLSTTSGASTEVTGLATGTTTITARTDNDRSVTTVVTVTAGTVSTVTVSLNPTSVKKNQKSTATATVKDAAGLPLSGATVTWQATAGASVPSGVTTTNAQGTATTQVTAGNSVTTSTIRATSGANKFGTAILTITN